MINNRDIIIQLKQVREEKGLSYNDILTLVRDNNGDVSRSSIQRVFAEGSEEETFKFEETIKPIADALLDINSFEDDDDLDTKAMKSLLQYKSQRIIELERHIKVLEGDIAKIKLSNHERMDKERERWSRSIDFLKHQIELKDERMDKLLEAVFNKDKLYNELLEKTLNCHCCPNSPKDKNES